MPEFNEEIFNRAKSDLVDQIMRKTRAECGSLDTEEAKQSVVDQLRSVLETVGELFEVEMGPF